MTGILLFFFLFGIAREAHVSQIVPDPVSLDDVLRGSSYVVVAKKADPFIWSQTIDITPAHPAPGKEYPPYHRIFRRFVVLDVLYSSKAISPGQTIQVLSPSDQLHFVMRQAYYLGQPVPSVSVKNYESGLDPEKEQKLILFLGAGTPPDFVLAVDNAFESVSRRAEIERRLKNIRR